MEPQDIRLQMLQLTLRLESEGKITNATWEGTLRFASGLAIFVDDGDVDEAIESMDDEPDEDHDEDDRQAATASSKNIFKMQRHNVPSVKDS